MTTLSTVVPTMLNDGSTLVDAWAGWGPTTVRLGTTNSVLYLFAVDLAPFASHVFTGGDTSAVRPPPAGYAIG